MCLTQSQGIFIIVQCIVQAFISILLFHNIGIFISLVVHKIASITSISKSRYRFTQSLFNHLSSRLTLNFIYKSQLAFVHTQSFHSQLIFIIIPLSIHAGISISISFFTTFLFSQ
jgi:hypothetical protein